MIEKMKTVSVICLKDDQEMTLNALRELDLLHVKQKSFQASRKLSDVQKELDSLSRVINLLAGMDAPDNATPSDLSAEELVEKIQNLNATIAKSRDEQDQLTRYQEILEPWGTFDPKTLTELRANGIDVRLCSTSATKLPELPDTMAMTEINRIGDQVYFAVVSNGPVEMELPEVILPENWTLPQIAARKSELAQVIEANTNQLQQMAASTEILANHRQHTEDEEEFLATQEQMGIDAELATITGYVPDKTIKTLKAAAMKNGWALQINDPADDDVNVPTMITTPKWLNIAKPLFDLVGITPGYREFDITAWFLIFFTIFFAIIVGDGGYGAIFLVGAIVARIKADDSAKVAVNLLTLLSVCTIIWGFLTGNFFGMNSEMLPGFMQGLPYFTGENAQANTQFFCFLIGAVHLTIGHGIKLSAVINSTMALAQLGWIAVIWGYFFLGTSLVTGSVFPEWAKYLFAVGAGLIVLFSVPTRNILKAIGGGLGEFMGGIVNSFVDVLSYIRLFAVGLSSYYVAVSFNDMGAGICGAGEGFMSILMLIAGAIVIVFGHTLNIALCGLSVLVHGIRLNTLEFSGHVGLEWAGIPFRAFRKRVK